jgi:hypothetical protein
MDLSIQSDYNLLHRKFLWDFRCWIIFKMVIYEKLNLFFIFENYKYQWSLVFFKYNVCAKCEVTFSQLFFKLEAKNSTGISKIKDLEKYIDKINNPKIIRGFWKIGAGEDWNPPRSRDMIFLNRWTQEYLI